MKIFRSLFYIFIVLQMSCAVNKKFTNSTVKFADNIVVAHRGAWKAKGFPQNSLASLREAIRLGFTGSEFDVRMTSDDSLIINHDPEYNGMNVEKSTYAQLIKIKLKNGEKLPTLREYLAEGLRNNTATRLVCEIKPSAQGKEKAEAVAEKVWQQVEEMNAQSRTVYISFDINILKRLKQIQPSVSTQYLNGDLSPTEVTEAGIDGIDYSLKAFEKHPEWVAEAKEKGMILNGWTVNDTADIDRLIAQSFTFITTNEPELSLKRQQDAPQAKGWKIVWQDEFEMNGLPDNSKWNYGTGGGGFGNNEKQYYTEANLENIRQSKGILHLVALKKDFDKNHYTSGKLITYGKFSMQYGKVEVRAKLPAGKGTWPAIWMLPESLRDGKEKWPLSGEIDIMEHVGKDINEVHVSLHSELYNHIKNTQVTHHEQVNNATSAFHTYGIEWDKNEIRFIIDGKLFFKNAKGENGHDTTNEGWPFDKSYYLILNLAIGGNWGGEIDDSIFPSDFQIDYVRVYKK